MATIYTANSTQPEKPSHVEYEGFHTDIDLLLGILPEHLKQSISLLKTDDLLEVIMDLGRSPEARLTDRVQKLIEQPVLLEDISRVVSKVGEFTDDNRAGIPRTLHRISCIRNRHGQIIGLTLRVGRTVFGTINLLRDLVETGLNLLLLGRPGVGKTTKLREMARVLADDLHKRVIVIDTSNEIGGDGDIPHPVIGGARRMQVPKSHLQHAVMIEAVENHMPEVIIVDEIGTQAEAAAARTIAERGVQLIGTAHGTTLENLILNPTLSDLAGGVHTVTLSDDEARRRRTGKTTNERRAPPTFDIVVELVNYEEVVVHRDTARAVDSLLNGIDPHGERRKHTEGGKIDIKVEPNLAILANPRPERVLPMRPILPAPGEQPIRIFPYGISRDLLDRVLRNLGISAQTIGRPENAELIIALRSSSGDLKLKRIIGDRDLPVHWLKKDNSTQMRRLLQDIFGIAEGENQDYVHEALEEVEHAIQRVLSGNVSVALAPRGARLRRMQHRVISRYKLAAESAGTEPACHLIIYPPFNRMESEEKFEQLDL
ncbi:MAG: R3H domain-containing nucleic acid-binding protein [Bdellovibrionia bacterium]